MTIHLNGSANPLAVNFNGTSLDTVYANIGGVPSIFPVWEKDGAFPESLGSVVTVTHANGVKMYYRNMVLVNTVIYSSDGKHHARYEGDVTLNVSFAKGLQIGASPTANEPYTWYGTSSSITATSGIPSGLRFDSGGSEDSSSHTLAFDVYHTTDGVLRPSQLYPTNLQSYITIYSAGYMTITTYMPGNNWPVLTRSSGWIYQGRGRLTLIHS